ncbi:translation initiation factor 1 [Allopseudospirillum japonicum]|uniref:Translation initiation factor 1 n=1 Tax=Allopseudospirillum japonicum TaxID=64971 RepID=A0A1H6U0Z8_9GAMM|nr:translation initiation factor [Allopseudospirillum japonicum]SEI85983.1 translation initiation factor 1 [Allopseudospirillum japonicum]
MSSWKDQLQSLTGYTSSTDASSQTKTTARGVYATDAGTLCPDCQTPLAACQCQQLAQAQRLAACDGTVRLSYETKGRKGKGVTCIRDLPLEDAALKTLCSRLKKVCGTGGSLHADGHIELQGDKRTSIEQWLQTHYPWPIQRVGG